MAEKNKKRMEISLDELVKCFSDFVKTVACLRDQKVGCVWDLKQTHETLRQFMLEEAYEAYAALARGKPEEIVDELGDVLLQVVLNAQIGCDNQQFSLIDVIRNINHKMIRRHPHVFTNNLDNRPNREQKSLNESEIKEQWESIKRKERAEKQDSSRTFISAYGTFPAAIQAIKIGREAKKNDFDWKSSFEVLKQLKSEIQELEIEMTIDKTKDDAAIKEELGDVYFTLAQLCRFLGHDPELVAQDGNEKFLTRFYLVEELARVKNQHLASMSREAKESLWIEAKKEQKKRQNA